MTRTMIWLTAMIALWLQGCSAMQVDKTPLPKQIHHATLALIPFTNYTQTPMAGYRAAAFAQAVAREKGLQIVALHMRPDPDALDENTPDPNTFAAEAKRSGARYLLTGEVTEWRYKTGIDGEPAVGLVVRIVDLTNDKTLYSAAGSKSGWGHQSIGVVAQSLLERIVP